MPFREVEHKAQFNALDNQISIDDFGRIRLAKNLMRYFPSKTMKVFIDKENKKLGLKDSGLITLRKNSSSRRSPSIIASVSMIKQYGIKIGRYSARWSSKHKMVIAEIDFNEQK